MVKNLRVKKHKITPKVTSVDGLEKLFQSDFLRMFSTLFEKYLWTFQSAMCTQIIAVGL